MEQHELLDDYKEQESTEMNDTLHSITQLLNKKRTSTLTLTFKIFLRFWPFEPHFPIKKRVVLLLPMEAIIFP